MQNTILSSSAHLRAYLRATRSNGEIYTTREIYGVQEARPDCPPTASTAQPVRAAAVSYGAFAPSAWSGRAASSRRVKDGRPDSDYDFQFIFIFFKFSASLLSAHKRGIPFSANRLRRRVVITVEHIRDDTEPAVQVVSSGRTGKHLMRLRCHYIISAALLL